MLEKPITTIRKAVEGTAREAASKEFLDKPEARHYEQVFEMFKMMRDSEPKMLEGMIKIAAANKDLEDKLEPESYKVFKMVSNELSDDTQKKIAQVMMKIQIREDVNEENLVQELAKAFKNISDDSFRQTIEDPRIKEAFKGKEENLVDIGQYLESLNQPMAEIFAETIV